MYLEATLAMKEPALIKTPPLFREVIPVAAV